MASTYQFGDKEYTKQQVIDYGREHYPKLYWIKRGIGIGAIASAILVVLVVFFVGAFLEKEVGNENMYLYYQDPRMVAYYISSVLLAIVGVGLIVASFAKPTDEQCFIHGEKCLRQIARDRAYFRRDQEEQ